MFLVSDLAIAEDSVSLSAILTLHAFCAVFDSYYFPVLALLLDRSIQVLNHHTFSSEYLMPVSLENGFFCSAVLLLSELTL